MSSLSKQLQWLWIVALMAGASSVSAQQSAVETSYRNAIGLAIDFGDYPTLAGASGKHFFGEHHAAQAEILFGDHFAEITAYYLYHREFSEGSGFRWFMGGGATLQLHRKFADFFLKPVAGLDYKFNKIPVNISADWRPAFKLTHNSSFLPARFGFAFRYALD